MKTLVDKNYHKDCRKISDKKLVSRAFSVIELLEKSESLNNFPNIVKMSGYQNFYRIRVGNYRIGIRQDQDKILVLRFLPRKDIYRVFP